MVKPHVSKGKQLIHSSSSRSRNYKPFHKVFGNVHEVASSSAALNNGVGSFGFGRSKNKGPAGIVRALNTRRKDNNRKSFFSTLQKDRIKSKLIGPQLSLRAYFAKKYLKKQENARNCWLNALKSSGVKFQLSCTDDGKFSPKQCTNNRCWCVNDVGIRIRSGGDDGFYNGRREGLALKCPTNRT
ncbi:uncharacterized protein LOC117113560 isoform X2 [Anneissia japonica]|uniref:uncharacterized protein LOC117113560 isoform X2 n=1 Tax=Anneissia japonica TaxID=1529436 RepID=UPI0014257FBB|nr:uncharacterized protein LOC117113560 isoform X2 [Anneissia japonica]